MFTPSELEEIPLEIQRIFSDLEMRIMHDIVDRISTINEISRTADWRIYTLSRMGISSNDIKKAIQSALNKSDAEIERIYNQVLEEGYARDKSLYEAVGKSFIPFKDNADLQNYINAMKVQTKWELVNITQSMGIATDTTGRRVFNNLTSYYQRILDNAVTDITTGTFDYNSLIKKVINEMTSSGIRSVVYDTGYTNRVEVAARRALMTGVSQVLVKNTEQVAKDLETEYFEVSWHSTARPTHQVWQGRVFTKEEIVTKCGLGKVDGLLGANCYHAYYPFIPGISKRTYTDEELDKMNAKENEKKLYKGKEYNSYEATQRQRKLETQMRAYKREIKLLEQANASSDDIRNIASKYQATMQEYVEFSKKMGLPQQRERIFDGTQVNTRLVKSVKNDIIKTRIQNGEYSTNLSKQQYMKHFEGTKQYQDYLNSRELKGKTPQSIITIDVDTLQGLIKNLSGTGIVGVTETGQYKNIEYVNCDMIIGKYYSEGSWHDTGRMAIHYGKKGSHGVPVKEEK